MLHGFSFFIVERFKIVIIATYRISIRICVAMRIAILGAGFAGLSTAWHLLYNSQAGVSIDLYDPVPIGQGVSGISSGLLHPYAGKHAKKAKDAEAKIDAVHNLIKQSSQTLAKPVVLSHGILRPAITPEQIADFKKCAVENIDTQWWLKEECEEKVPGLRILPSNGGGLFIKRGLTLDVPTYMEGLWQAVALMGTQYYPTAVIKEQDLKQYDRIVFALGYAIRGVKNLETLPVESIKGQSLILKWPSHLPPLPFSIISEGYIAMGKDMRSCIAGSTFERQFKDIQPDPEFARKEIERKVCSFFPDLENAELISCHSGVRAASKANHQPLVGRATDKFWFITGLGSKGLLYHAWLGNHLSLALLKNDTSLLPKDLHYTIQ
jgi:glycine/D-amino acid oxidase-like deaminating enzyme